MSRRNENRRGIAGRGAAMAVESESDISHIICYNCGEKGNFKGDCPALAHNKVRRNSSDGRQRKDKAEPGGCAGQKWCSFDNSATHNEADCRAQGKPRQQHASESYTATATLSATSPPHRIKEDSDFDCGFM